jgi:hypothetical protein
MSPTLGPSVVGGKIAKIGLGAWDNFRSDPPAGVGFSVSPGAFVQKIVVRGEVWPSAGLNAISSGAKPGC